MSLFLEMLQAARLAPTLLGESTDLVRAFLVRQQNPDGGFKDRAGRSDLYYTVFGLAALAALEPSLPNPLSNSALLHAAALAEPYLSSFASGQHLDLVHLCCLARNRVVTGGSGVVSGSWVTFKKELLDRLESYRTADGGYHPGGHQPSGTVYAAFLVAGAYQDLNATLPQPEKLAASLRRLATSNGAWVNEAVASGVPAEFSGSTNVTAAAIALLRHLGQPVGTDAVRWLQARVHPQGGFLAAPTAPMPDLLSTATALHALAGLGVPLTELRDKCLDFVDTLWTSEGGFHGHWGDNHLDCEYTFYGLLALGHLAQ